MTEFTVSFYPQNKVVKVKQGSTLLEAAWRINLIGNNLCGGDGICGRCKMIVKKGKIAGKVSGKLGREEIKQGYVLACMTRVEGDLIVEIPAETWAREKTDTNEDADRFRDMSREVPVSVETGKPLVRKIYLELEKPTLWENTAIHQKICSSIRKQLGLTSLQMGLKIIRTLPAILEAHDYRITATVGIRRDIAEIMNIEGGNTADKNYMVIVDIGTTTVIAHLVNTNALKTMDARACFNSQGAYGRDITNRIIAAEKRGDELLQTLLVDDINNLIRGMAHTCGINVNDIGAIVCAGNTAITHFLLGLPTRTIRRAPYTAITVEPPTLRAVEVGIEINARGLLYALPGISGWVGGDLTAGILATGLYKSTKICLLVDIGTNGEIIIGGRDWLMAASASAGPALEGANEESGMRAERGAIEKVFVKSGKILYKTIGLATPRGICGSGIIDLLAVLLQERIIDRSGKFITGSSEHLRQEDGVLRFVLVDKKKTDNARDVFITEVGINNIIVAKAAIYAAMKILCHRLDLDFGDISHFFIAGAFGNFINIESAITIGLIPDIERSRIEFAGNTSIRGAKQAAFSYKDYAKLTEIRSNTTYYDLMGAADYVEEFQRAIFLPHTDIEEFSHTGKIT